MAAELRKTGISVVGDLPWGAHFCYFYETKQDLLDILIPYFKTGLENKEFCLWVISNSELLTVEEAKSALRNALPDLDRHVAERNIEIVGHDEWFLEGETFDRYTVADRFKKKLSEALARGYEGMRVNGSPAWLRDAGSKELKKFEAELDKLFPNERTIAACTYPLAVIGPDEIFDVVRTHQFALARRQGEWEIIETQELIQAKAEIKSLNEALEQRVIERTNDLRVAIEELRKEIAERKRAEDRLLLVVDTIPAMVFTALPDGSVDFVNQRWLQYLGLSMEDVEGWGWAPTIHPEDRERSIDHWRSTIAAGQSAENELRVRRADGVYRWILGRFVPLRDESGQIVKWYGVSSDIEDRKQAEEKLRQSETQLVEAQRLAHVGSWEWDLRSNAVTWSDELYRIFGLPPGKIMVRGDARQFIHPEDRDLVSSTVQSSVKNKEPYSFYYRILRPGGDERIVHSRGHIMSDEDGNPIRVFGATEDVTELKRAEEKLKTTTEQLRALSARLQMAKEEESSRIARELHDELGSALTSLKWNLDLLEKNLLRSAEDDRHSRMRQQIKDMAALIDNTINSVRRISAELRPSMLDDLGLVVVVQSYLRQFQERTGIVTRFESSVGDLQLTPPQSTALFRIFQEALTNILRHAQATKINISIREEDRRFVLMVRDNGRGITESEKSSGLSLGLLGMEERARLVGGEIEIATRKEGGTVITVKVPIAR